MMIIIMITLVMMIIIPLDTRWGVRGALAPPPGRPSFHGLYLGPHLQALAPLRRQMSTVDGRHVASDNARVAPPPRSPHCGPPAPMVD